MCLVKAHQLRKVLVPEPVRAFGALFFRKVLQRLFPAIGDYLKRSAFGRHPDGLEAVLLQLQLESERRVPDEVIGRLVQFAHERLENIQYPVRALGSEPPRRKGGSGRRRDG